MLIRPIRNEKDYDLALSEIEALMDAQPGTEGADQLDVWVTLVEAYEARHRARQADKSLNGWVADVLDAAARADG